MPFTPAIPVGGLAGFRFLERTITQQFAAFDRSPDISREIDYFRENAGQVISAQDLVSDRRLLNVVLTAYGLEDDLNKGAFIRKVVEEGTFNNDAFANRLVEPAYRKMSEDLGIGNFGSRLSISEVREEIILQYRVQSFEIAVGEVDVNLRLALNFQRGAAEIVSDSGTVDTKWLRLLGSTPLRQVVEGGFFLPPQTGAVDLDQQLDLVKSQARKLFGTSDPAALLDPENMQLMIDRFLLRQQTLGASSGANTSGSAALSILQSSTLGAGAQQSLFSSNFL